MNAPRCVSVALTHPGKVRRVNEDSYLDRPDLGLWVVADGMGGHEAGDVASRLVVEALGRVRQPASGPAFMAEVKACVVAANRSLREEARSRGSTAVVASTVVGLLIIDGYFACLWAGDSRLYLLRGGRLSQVTRDHSYVQELVDRGALRAEEAERHPQANVVMRAVGAEDELDLDVVQARLFPNDVFLLCSDGLSRLVESETIAAALRTNAPADAARALVDAALERGGSDNVTVVIVKSLP